MTEKLFYQDSYMTDFDAVVLSCMPKGENYEIVLDRTAFFPEGGGQYADTGRLGKAEVLDVHERDGVIYHLTNLRLEEGASVKGRIDGALRFVRMQQHTGEHIVSGLIHREFGYDNVGFHLGNKNSTMDFNGELTAEELRRIEWRANEAVAKNLAVEVSYPSREELSALEYRSKKEIQGQVRIVAIPGYDVCACCAPHLNRTGETGMIRLVDMQRYKGGVRVTMLCGFRALMDYREKDSQVKAISAMLCAKGEEVAKAVRHLKDEAAALKAGLIKEQRNIIAIKAKEEALKPDKFPCLFEEGLKGDGIRILMNEILAAGKAGCAVFLKTEKEEYRYVIGSGSLDVRPIAKGLNDTFFGRGGGKREMVQGSLKGKETEIKRWLQKKVGMING